MGLPSLCLFYSYTHSGSVEVGLLPCRNSIGEHEICSLRVQGLIFTRWKNTIGKILTVEAEPAELMFHAKSCRKSMVSADITLKLCAPVLSKPSTLFHMVSERLSCDTPSLFRNVEQTLPDCLRYQL